MNISLVRKFGLPAAYILFIVLAPMVMQQSLLLQFSQVLAFGLAISGLNIVSGFGGQISLGHGAFFGLGGYTATILVHDHGVPILLTLPVAAAIGFVVGVVAGLPALRLQGHYLGLATLGFAVAFPLIVTKLDGLTGGANGKLLLFRWELPVDGPSWLTSTTVTFAVIAIVTGLGLMLMTNLTRYGPTRVLIAIRENPTAATVNGVNMTREKTISFATGAAVTAVAGVLYAMTIGVVAPEVFGLMLSIQLLTGLLLGGAGSLVGPLLGGVVLVFLPSYTSALVGGVGANMVYGAILIVLMFLMPTGIAGGFRALAASVHIRRINHKRKASLVAQGLVPSPHILNADSKSDESLKELI